MNTGMYATKKKKVVDPNAPPRPNLLDHEKRLKDTTATMGSVQQELLFLRNKIEQLESKLLHQTNYLNAMHGVVSKLQRDR